MMAAVLVLDPVFEADLQPEQYAYRLDRSALATANLTNQTVNNVRTARGKIMAHYNFALSFILFLYP
jgi:hypothetical protein